MGDYTDEIQAEIFEKYIKSANEIDFTKILFLIQEILIIIILILLQN